MYSYAIGADGALCIDERLNIVSLMRPDKVTEHLFANACIAIGDDKGRLISLSEFSEIKCKQAFLGATYKFEDKMFSAKISARVLTPFGFGPDSHLPAAAFSFKIKNTSKKKRKYTFGFLAENVLDDSFHECVTNEYGCGLQLGSASMLSVQPSYMTQCVLFSGEAQSVKYICRESIKESFFDSIKSGKIEDMNYTLPGHGDCGAVMQHFSLEHGESIELKFVYSWHMPNLYFETIDGDGLLFKNAYEKGFADSVDVAVYVLENWDNLVGFSNTLTDAVRESVDIKAFESAVFDNFRTICNHSAYCLDEIGNAKMFYKNHYGASRVYARKFNDLLFPANVYFDFENEVEEIAWILEYATGTDGLSVGVQSVTEKLAFNNAQESACVHMSPIWRVYRLYLLRGDISFIIRFWDDLKRILTYVNEAGWVRIGETVFLTEEENETVLSNFYILALMCMERMALLVGEEELATEYGKLASDGKKYVKRNLFNGRYYVRALNAMDKCDNFEISEILPMQIGVELGFHVADEGQLLIALENLYVSNYSEELCGLKSSSCADEIKARDELMYAQLLLRQGKNYLAALICKAQYARENAPHEGTPENLFLHALANDGYDYKSKHLHIGTNGLICFAGHAVLLADGKKRITVRILGTPVRIDSLSVEGKKKPQQITCGGMELMYTLDKSKILFNAPLNLRAGEQLEIFFN